MMLYMYMCNYFFEIIFSCPSSLSLRQLPQVNLSPSYLSLSFFCNSKFMHCEHLGMGMEDIGMNGTKHVFPHFPQFP
tara:strand:- start:90 stop:320 length:231 start_codon:yes stop_codon:yes gene_type:complete